MTHLGYILAAYGAAFIVIVGLILWVWLDLAAQKRKLARLDRDGTRRRSRRPAA
ncbi:heme exporter protein CcmD [Faunimonas pinastri]|uniref:Heme exporter protein D n=1 Tax=Faunimonas pinastri TaxID=1855383 RepID=A0A1H9MDJ3_9HYPH|nr:heme exporter protein CcmD [Faunimonas pinastri]SER21776.1 heme exporter protein CcmD [Faunimonas pinastri]